MRHRGRGGLKVLARQRAIGDAMVTVGSALALVLALALFDDRVRDQIGQALDPRHPAATLTGLGGRASEVVGIVAVAVRAQSIEHAPLVIFALAATVLVLFMLRT